MGRLLQFRRREESAGQSRLPLGRASQGPLPPLDEQRLAHRRRMLRFLAGQPSGGSIGHTTKATHTT
jgi:hypothetical protein